MVDVFQSSNPKYYPLTHPQKRIWYMENLYPHTSLNNITGSVTIKGPVKFELLEAAIRLQMERHDALRIRIIEIDGEPQQFVDRNENTGIDFIDFSGFENPEKEFKRWLEREVQTSISLEKDRLCYIPMFKVSERKNGFLVKFHHIISDGWSSNLIIDQIHDSYMRLMKGESAELHSVPSYLDYIGHEHHYLQSARFQKNKSFWNEKFSTVPEVLGVNEIDFISGNRKTYIIDANRSSNIKEFAANAKCSINALFIFLYMLYECKTAGQNERVIGTPVFNRSGQKDKGTAGMFTSTMPFRYLFDANRSVMETLAHINHQLAECFYNQKYPYDLLVLDLELNKKGRTGLFNTCVNYYNTKVITVWNGSPVKVEERYNGCQFYSLQLVLKDWSESGALTLDIDYKNQAYTEQQINGLYHCLNTLIDAVISRPGEKIGNLSLLTESEKRRQIYAFNDTRSDYPYHQTVHRLFEQQAERTPDRVAVAFDQDELTYRELNEKSNQLARYLANQGVGRESVVGLLTCHSMETVVGILGILKAGGAYLPIDPAYPDDRIEYMLRDSGCSMLLTNIEVEEQIRMKGKVVNLQHESCYPNDSSNLEIGNDPGDLVYIIYTSGSTGKPKGTMIEHRGLMNYIWWAKKMYVKDEQEVFPFYSSLAFDLTVTSIFTPLIAGGSILVYRDDGDEYVLFRIMNDKRATVIKLTPSHLSLLKDRDNRNSSVKRFIIGGEDLRTSLAGQIHESFGGKVELYNEYGPTETVVGCMIHLFDADCDDKASVPIGVPADNVQIYILDSNLNPLPVHAIGELYISGDGLARGYMNRPDLTGDKFIPNPFIIGKRMYRTGDLARLSDTGQIEYVGRADHQVKIRGHRIELGEIERHLCEHSFVADAVVINRQHPDESQYLCAYLVTNGEFPSDEWRSHLSGRLPKYMIPAHFIVLDEIPLNVNGKVNRALLPEPENKHRTELAGDSFANETEADLIDILSVVLQTGGIRVSDNFYHLGGDSIKAIQAASKLKGLGYAVKVADMLSIPVIGNMAKLLVRIVPVPIADQRRCVGGIRLTPIMSWFFAQNFSNTNYYNQSLLLHMKQDIPVDNLQKIIEALIEHHDALRMNVSAVTRELFYNEPGATGPIEVFNLADYDDEVQKRQMRLLGQKFKASMDIHRDPLLKACVFDLGEKGTRLLLTAHHLGVDGVSWRILLEDFVKLYLNTASSRNEPLPWKTDSLQTWAEYLWRHTEETEEEQEYWEYVLDERTPVPVDFALGEDTAASSETVTEQLTESETEQLLGRANAAYGTETKDLLIAALADAIFDEFKMNEVVIELEGHGRESFTDPIDVSRTVGWFTSIYPVKLAKVSSGLPNQLKSMKEQLRKIPRKGIGFGSLAYLSQTLKYNGQRKRIRFNYLGDFDGTFNNDLFSLSNEPSGAECGMDEHLTSLMEINAIVVDRRLNISVTYSSRVYQVGTIQGVIRSCVNQLKTLIRHCCEKNGVDFTPSDFETIALSQDELEGLYF